MKLIKYIKQLSLIILAVTLFIGCDDLLNESPMVELTDDAFWKTPADFAMGTNKLYEFLPKIMNRTDAGDNPKDINCIEGLMHRDVDADMAANWVSSTIMSSSAVGNEDGYNKNLYKTYYSSQRKVNFVLERAEKYENQAAIKQYVGECYFFRALVAYAYYRDFGPAIIINKVTDVDSPELNQAQADRLEFFNWMIEDLTKAESLLTANSALSKSDIGRISMEAAKALKARLYLFEGTWQKYHYNNRATDAQGKSFFKLAADNAKAVIGDETQFTLFRNEQMGDESYRWMFILESSTQCNPFGVLKNQNKEYILRNRFDENAKRSNNNTSHTAQAYYASRKMTELYLDINGLPIEHANSVFKGYSDWDSFMQDRDPRLRYSIGYVGQQVWTYGANGRVNWKNDNEDKYTQAFIDGDKKAFRNRKWVTERNMNAYEDGYDVPVIRLAEMYLTYAEAVYEDNDGNISDEDLNFSLNKVRERVSMPALTNSFVSTNGLNMLNEIRRERTVEFYLEGMRLDDLRRWKIAEVEMSKNIEGFPYTYKGGATIYNTASKVFELKDADGNVYLNDRNRPRVTYTYRKTASPEAAYDDGSSYVVFQKGEDRQFKSYNYYRPVPRTELDLNPNLKPSPGWEK